MGVLADILKSNKTIASVNNNIEMEYALKTGVKAICISKSTLNDFEDKIKAVKKAGKVCFINIDNISGLTPGASCADYVMRVSKPDVALTDIPENIARIQSKGICAMLYIRLSDISSLDVSVSQINKCRPDGIELIPGMIPKAIEYLKRKTSTAVVAGGLFIDDEDTLCATEAGAIAYTTTKTSLWK